VAPSPCSSTSGFATSQLLHREPGATPRLSYAEWMSTQAQALSLGRESGDDGSFRRQESTFRKFVSADDSAEFPVAAGRYHLYVARACPWAHRTLIGRRLMGLQDAIGVSFVDPLRDDRSWKFTGGEYVDAVNGFTYLSEAYRVADPGFDERVSVPVLWDKQRHTIVNNESEDILRMLSTVFAPLAEHPVVLYPEDLRDEIDALNQQIYDNVNNAVYKAGFARKQAIYEHEVQALFQMLDELDLRLADRRFLFGGRPLETDWRLFTTLVRFDAVYQIHFKCSIRKLVEYENLWPYARDLYQWPGVAETVSFDEIRTHYYGTHPMINPSGLVALLPAASFDEPAGRG
jgi:glutathionyl-hydroquinone reductase